MINVNYNSLKWRIDTLNDYMNINNDDNNNDYVYITKPIIKSEIKLIDIKAKIELDYLYSNKQHITFLFMSNNNYYYKLQNCIIIISVYDNTTNSNSLLNPIIHSANIYYLLSSFVLKHNFKYILLPVLCQDLQSSDISLFNKNNIDSNLNMLILYNNNTNKIKLLSDIADILTEDDWFNVIFQVLYTLYLLNIEFYKFIHNSLSLSSIIINSIDCNDNTENTIYNINDMKYKLPECSFEIKIINFNKTYIQDFYNQADTDNDVYYDINYFFSEIKKIKKIHSMTPILQNLINIKNKEPKNIIIEYFANYHINNNIKNNMKGGFSNSINFSSDEFDSLNNEYGNLAKISYNNEKKISNINYMIKPKVKIPKKNKYDDDDSSVSNNFQSMYTPHNNQMTSESFNPLNMQPQNTNSLMSMQPQMNMPQMSMPPQMNIPQMNMPQMSMPPQMNMPQMNMPQMSMPPQMNMEYNVGGKPKDIEKGNYGYQQVNNKMQGGSHNKYKFVKNNKELTLQEAGFFFLVN